MKINLYKFQSPKSVLERVCLIVHLILNIIFYNHKVEIVKDFIPCLPCRTKIKISNGNVIEYIPCIKFHSIFFNIQTMKQFVKYIKNKDNNEMTNLYFFYWEWPIYIWSNKNTAALFVFHKDRVSQHSKLEATL
jgi:hypothetical protein